MLPLHPNSREHHRQWQLCSQLTWASPLHSLISSLEDDCVPSSATWIIARTPITPFCSFCLCSINCQEDPFQSISQSVYLLCSKSWHCFVSFRVNVKVTAWPYRIRSWITPWDLIPYSLSLAHCIQPHQLPALAHTQFCSYCSYFLKCSPPLYLLCQLPHFFLEFI